MRKFKKIAGENLNRIQENIGTAIDQIIDKQVIDGVLLKDVDLTAGSVVKVSHKLSRNPVGYIIVKRNANSTIWDTALDNKTISLNCSVNVTVSIWIF